MHSQSNSEYHHSLSDRWSLFELEFERKFLKKPTVETAFFIIGVEHNFKGLVTDKTEKELLISEGFHIALEKQGYFIKDKDGSWKETKPLPQLGGAPREEFYREAVLTYFGR